MAFKHTPSTSCTTTTPDKFTDDDGTVYLAGYSELADDPRRDWDVMRTELYVYHSATRATDDRGAEPEHPAIQAFIHYYDTDLVPRGTDRSEHALAKTRRYMAAFIPEWRGVIHLVPGRGYDQSSWHEAIIALEAYDGWSPTTENAEAFGKEYTQWRYGDVYWVENVDTGDALHGIYADSMEDAVRYYIEGGY